MKIKKLVVMAIKGNKDLRRKIKDLLDISEPTLYRLLTTEDNDDLTKASVLKLLREELNLTDAEILEDLEMEDKHNAPAA